MADLGRGPGPFSLGKERKNNEKEEKLAEQVKQNRSLRHDVSLHVDCSIALSWLTDDLQIPYLGVKSIGLYGTVIFIAIRDFSC